MYQGKNGSTEHSKGYKTVPEKVATTRTEDGQKQTAKTGTEIQTGRKMEHWTTEEEMEGLTALFELNTIQYNNNVQGGAEPTDTFQMAIDNMWKQGKISETVYKYLQICYVLPTDYKLIF